ncbi:MAG: hypothetical protein ACRYFX_09985 [Janthinobacterium lividum]
MTEQQVKAATAVYGQLVEARQELNRLLAIRPLLSGLTLQARPGTTVGGIGTVRVSGLRPEQLRAMADLAEQTLRQQIADLEKQLAGL